jgi:heme-degrading monooxygenase HmoA
MITIVFRGRINEGSRADFQEAWSRLYESVKGRAGFLGAKDFRADDGEQLTLIHFADIESVREWREYPDHREAIHKGYLGWFDTYDISVCQVLRRYTREERREAVARGAPEPGSVPIWESPD